MKRILCYLFWSALGVVILGCAAKLTVVASKAMPSIADIGEPVKFMVQVKGPTENISSVKGVIREYPEYVIELNDGGEKGDEKANDGIWSYQTNIPMSAESGTYHLEVVIKDKEGKELVSKGFEGQSYGKGGTIELNVK